MNESNSSEQEITRRMEEELKKKVPEYDGSQQLFKDPFWKRHTTIYI